ncbi:zinc-ribbon domain-containing protein [Pelagibacteraceae bacterium]|nr:zinc-ribbon domain-containing protein [Pelagibacteraceae bacterium]
MFIVCANCEFKYLVNSADLKPNGRMVECANCGHQWLQTIDEEETSSAVPSTNPSTNKINFEKNIINDQKEEDENKKIRNLPSTIVREEKPSIRNSLIAVFLILSVFFGLWFARYYGINTFVLIDFYIREFFFNLNLIFSDLAKIIYDTLN